MINDILAASVAVALAFGGGFFVSIVVMKNSLAKSITRNIRRYYLTKYNEQMAELIARYRQERAMFAHRYSNTIQELELEIVRLRSHIDFDKTKTTHIKSNEEAIIADEAVS